METQDFDELRFETRKEELRGMKIKNDMLFENWQEKKLRNETRIQNMKNVYQELDDLKRSKTLKLESIQTHVESQLKKYQSKVNDACCQVETKRERLRKLAGEMNNKFFTGAGSHFHYNHILRETRVLETQKQVFSEVVNDFDSLLGIITELSDQKET